MPLVKMENISKNFGKVQALKDVDLEIDHAEIIGIVGDNGAGKSTLIKILSGVYPPTTGEIHFKGKKVTFSSPKESIAMGIETVYQDMALLEDLSIERNIFIGREPCRMFMKIIPVLDKQKMKEEAEKSLRKIGINKKNFTKELVGNLSGGERQAVSVGRATYFKAKLVIMDEPTAAMSLKETYKILDLIRKLKERNASVLFISHNLHHVFLISDRIVILAHGRKIGEKETRKTCEEEIAELITKR